MMPSARAMSTPLRVLFIGESGAEGVAAELRSGGYDPSFEMVAESSRVRDALSTPWDIAISDFQTAGCGALEALRIVQESGVDLPVIVISGKIKDADVLAVLKAGAADHMTRANLMRLNAAVERELRAARNRRDRTRLEEQFRQAQKMEAVGRLAGGVAHDFNNLLTVITGYSDLLLAGQDLKESHRSALEQIRRSAERGGALTNQLLAFSRPQPLQARPVRMNELALQMEKMFRRLIGEDIELVTIAAATEDTVEADPGRLEQVIMNLVVNARDAMANGGKLTIETGTVPLDGSFCAGQFGVEPGRYVVIAVTDTGAGMDSETQSHLFEPFFTTKKVGRGTGLGLATAYGIIRQSHGAIRFESELGKGTTASIYLPLVEDRKRAAAETVPPRIAPTGAETVLLVEDEARVRKLILGILKAHGYTVLEATRGEEAIRLCKSRPGAIDLAVIDVVMPEMSGPDLARQIAPICPAMRVLYISGYTDEAVVHHGIPQSGVEFLQKPFLPEALLRKVREVLDARSNTA
jgi:two-component system, cell cycle sensor histidine kinase and response regulator CckA